MNGMSNRQFQVINGGWDLYLEEIAQYILKHPAAPENTSLIKRLEPAGYDTIYLICHDGKIVDPINAKRKKSRRHSG